MTPKRSISGMMHSLHFKVAAGVIFPVLALTTLYFVWDYHFYRTQLLSDLGESSENVSYITLNSLLQLAMVGRHVEMLQQGVEGLSDSSVRIRTIQILDPSGVVRFSSDRSQIGRPMTVSDPTCIECHEKAALPRSALIESGGETLLRYVAPIPNREECHSCHSPTRELVGLLLVDHSMAEAHEHLQATLYEMLIKVGTTVVAILLVLGFLMNRIVISRIKKLTAATSQLATLNTANLELESIGGNDEIGQLARSFEEMARRLRDSFRELEEKERIRISLLQRLVRTQEEERKTLSRELHDRLGQSLSALLLFSRTAFSGDRVDPAELERRRNDFEERIRSLIEQVHRLAWKMRPSILDDYGLEKALERFVEETSKASGIPIDFQQTASNGAGRLPHWLETTLYRVAQEGISNLVRHSEATQASVVLIRNPSNVTLIIEDNGVGFVPDKVVPTSRQGLGLAGMRERVRECSGSLDIESARLKGTTLRVRIPLEHSSTWESE